MAESLNADPFNVEAERLAMEDCMQGVDVRREWTETQMVMSFGGMMLPGTPDGMYEDHDGRLTCVQVVRVPLTSSMSPAEMENVYYQTVLTKLVKSQKWVLSTQTMPHEFIIFCWLPFATSEGTGDRAQALIERVRDAGWPFCLRAKVPAEPGALFPAMFAWRGAGREGGSEGHGRRRTRISESELSTVDPTEWIHGEQADEECDLGWDLFGEWSSADDEGRAHGVEEEDGPAPPSGEQEKARACRSGGIGESDDSTADPAEWGHGERADEEHDLEEESGPPSPTTMATHACTRSWGGRGPRCPAESRRRRASTCSSSPGAAQP